MNVIHEFILSINRMQWSDYLDIALVAYLIYKLMPLFRSRAVMRIVRTVVILVLAAWLTDVYELYTLNWLLTQLLAIGLLAFVVLFQPELRRMIDHLANVKLSRLFGMDKTVQEMDKVIAQTVMACEVMSRQRVGALIVFSREHRLEEYFKTGTEIDALVSEQLLRNLFFTNASLHDGAVIIQDGRVAAAGCVLPLSTSPMLSADLGTRHRASVGISEVSDAVAVVVSEETGTISVAVGGMLKRHLAPQTLEKLLYNELCPKDDGQKKPSVLKKISGKGKEADSYEKNKFYSLILSLVIAFGLWLYVINNVSMEDDTTIAGIPVALEGEAVLSERNLMLTELHTPTVSVHLSGARSDLGKVNSGNINVKCDLSGIYEPGERIGLDWTASFPGDVASNAFVIQSKKPDKVYVAVDYRRTKEIPVAVKWTGSRSGDYLYDTENAVLDYSTVTIVGPATVADQITQAVVEVDLSQRQESVSEGFRYTLCNAEGEPVDAADIMTNVEEIRLDLRIHRIKDLRLQVDVTYGGGATAENTDVTLSTGTIRVSGSDAALEALGDTYTVGSVNLKEVERDAEQKFGINLPEGVTNQTGINEVTASIRFNGLRTKELVIENIKSVNVPEGMEVEIISANLTVKVRGSEAEIKDLTEEDIYAEVDFTNAEAGTSTYKAKIIISSDFPTVGALKANAVSATVKPVEG